MTDLNSMSNEQLAWHYIQQSGKTVHASDCATSVAPAMRPGPCDCDAAQPDPLRDEATQNYNLWRESERELTTLREQLAAKEAEYQAVCERANQEAQLACDLRVAQDNVIERCAQACDRARHFAAGALLRSHADGISGEDWGELKRNAEYIAGKLAKLADLRAADQAEIAALRSELEQVKRERDEVSAKPHFARCPAARVTS